MEAKTSRRKGKIKVKPAAALNGHTNGYSNGHVKDHLDNGEQIDSKRLLQVLTEVKNGNFSVRLPVDETGMYGKICDTLNEIISLNEDMTREFNRASVTIGKQGKLTHRLDLPSKRGAWN